MGRAGVSKCIAMVLLFVHHGAGQGLSDVAAIVRHDVQQLATEVHVALGLERHSAPPATVVPVTTQAPTTTGWPTTSVLPDTSLLPLSTTAAPTSTRQPPVTSSTMAQSTTLAPPTSTRANPTTSLPTSCTTTPTSSAPTTTPTRACADSQILTFNGSAATPVGLQGPFNFSGWTYDSQSAIILPLYGQSILNQQSSTQVIEVTDIDGILLCGIAASGTNAPTNATFHGFTTFGTNVSTAASLPKYDSYANVTMDATWQPLRSISIVTTGNPLTYTTERWGIAFQYLSMR